MLSPVYDPNLGDALGIVEGYMLEAALRKWIDVRLRLLNLPLDYFLVPPPGWRYD